MRMKAFISFKANGCDQAVIPLLRESSGPDETIYMSQPLSKHTPLSTIGGFGSAKDVALIDGSLTGDAKP